MAEKTPDQIAYEQYLSEVGNAPIDPKVAKREQGILENAKSRRYEPRIYQDPSKEDVINSLPEGELYITGMARPELRSRLKKLTTAKRVFIQHLNPKQSQEPGLDNPRGTALLWIKDNSDNLPQDFVRAFQIIMKYVEPDMQTKLFDLPEMVEEFIQRYTLTLEHIDRKKIKKMSN